MSDLARGAVVAAATAGAVAVTLSSVLLVDLGGPNIWMTPLAAVAGGVLWGLAVSWALGHGGNARLVTLAAAAFAITAFLELQRPGWWIGSLVPADDGRERLHLGLGLTESSFVVAGLTTAGLALGLGRGRRAAAVGLAVGCAAAFGTALAYAVLDTAGLRLGGPPGSMVRLALASTAVGAVTGGALLVRLLRRNSVLGRAPADLRLGPRGGA